MAKTDPARVSHRVSLALRNGILLLCTLFAFRIEKIFLFQIHLGATDWLLALLPEIGTILIIEGFWAAIALFPDPWGNRIWKIGFHFTHGLLYTLAVIEHQFFLKTGTQIDISLLVYTIQHASELSGVVGSGMDLGFLQRTVIAVSCFSLGFKHKLSQWVSPTSAPMMVVVFVLAGPVLVAQAQSSGGKGIPFSTRLYVDLLHPIESDKIRDAVASAVPRKIYTPPQITNTTGLRQPNILFLILESTRADVLPPYSTPQNNADVPFFTKLALDSLVFDTVYTSVPHSSKAFVGIFCGMYPSLDQAVIESQPNGLPLRCLPNLLQELGYRSRYIMTARGYFENFSGLIKNMGFESLLNQEHLNAKFQRVGIWSMDEFAMLEPAVEWITQRDDRPFFLALLTSTTHYPYQPPGTFSWPVTGKEFSSYKQTVQHVDDFSSALYDQLQELGLLENTLIFVFSDHGEAFGEHYRMQHDVIPYEEGIRVPLYLNGPSRLVGAPRKVGGLRHHIDLLPTILEILNVKWKGHLPGKSLLSTQGHPFVVSSCWYTNYCLAIRQGSWKFIYHYGRLSPEVFNLIHDPNETNNLITNILPDHELTPWQKAMSLKLSVDEYYNSKT